MTDRRDATAMIAVATVIAYVIGRFRPSESCLLIMFVVVTIDIAATMFAVDPNFATAYFRSLVGAALGYVVGRAFRAHALRAAKRKLKEPQHDQPPSP